MKFQGYMYSLHQECWSVHSQTVPMLLCKFVCNMSLLLFEKLHARSDLSLQQTTVIIWRLPIAGGMRPFFIYHEMKFSKNLAWKRENLRFGIGVGGGSPCQERQTLSKLSHQIYLKFHRIMVFTACAVVRKYSTSMMRFSAGTGNSCPFHKTEPSTARKGHYADHFIGRRGKFVIFRHNGLEFFWVNTVCCW